MKRVLLITMFVLCWRQVSAETLYVPSEQYDNIQAAVDDANDADVIIVAPGTHTGPGNRDIHFDGKAITLQSINPNNPDIVAATIIDCNGSIADAHRAFYFFNSGEDTNSIINGLTITGGGGGIWGAIYCYGSSPTIKNCIITNNSMKDRGSGIFCGYDSNPIITNCIISSNTFTVVGYGGGIYCYQSSPTITNCILTNNSAVGHGRHGGAIYCHDQSDAIISNCLISGNTAGHRGGGISAYWSSPTITNCTVVGNSSLEGGGISSFRESNPLVSNCIVWDNRAPDGNQLALINTLRVWPWEEITEMTVSFSNIEGGWEQVCIDPDMILNWGDGNIDLDPNFVDPGYWDDNDTSSDPNDDFWVDGDYHLKSEGWRWDPNQNDWVYDTNTTSPCLDAGNPGCPLGEELLTIPVDPNNERGQNLRINMGAYGGTAEASMPPYDWAILSDLTNDGKVDLSDLAAFVNYWLDSGECIPSDLNRNQLVDFVDFALLAQDLFVETSWYTP